MKFTASSFTAMHEARLKLNRAFRTMRGLGYFARQNFMCCQGCGIAALPEGTQRYVFFHRQDGEHLRERGTVWLAWDGDGDEIVQTFQSSGLLVLWNGDVQTRILVNCRPNAMEKMGDRSKAFG